MGKRVVALLLACVMNTCLANDTQKIVMGYRTTEKPPSIEQAPSNAGYFKDIYSEAARRSALKLEIVRMPKKRILEGLKSGEIDFYPSFVFTTPRSAYTYWFDSGRSQKNVAISLSTLRDLKSSDDLKGLTQLVSVGSPDYLAGFDKSQLLENKMTEVSIERALSLLKSGRADFYIYQEDALRYHLKSNKLSGYKIHSQLLNESIPDYIGFSKKSALFNAIPNPDYDSGRPLAPDNLPEIPHPNAHVHRFNDALKAMSADGTTQRIYQTYFE